MSKSAYEADSTFAILPCSAPSFGVEGVCIDEVDSGPGDLGGVAISMGANLLSGRRVLVIVAQIVTA